MFFASQPASAAVSGTNFSVDRSTAKAGDQLTLTLALTNNEASDIYFAYESIQPTWPANQLSGVFTVTGCSGDTVDCSTAGNTTSFHFNAPIAPGATRTVTVTVKITDTPPWDTTTPYTLNWAPYVYYEFGQVGGTSTAQDQGWAFGTTSLQTTILG